jgi:hypothetical protein
MATLESVEKLRQKANVTYEEAKAALDACGDDILEAMIYLERQGKVNPPQNGGYYSSRHQAEPEKKDMGGNNRSNDGSRSGETFSQLAGRFFRWCGKIIEKGNQNSFEVRREDQVVISVPVTILVLLLIFAFWVVIPLIIVGLFFGCRYFFKGPDLEPTGMNRFMDSAANAAENFVNEVKGSNNGK